jgi:Fic family protein
MEVVSGGIGNERIHYLAPPREALNKEMMNFLKWFNNKDNTLVKAAIAHLWFVIIHPFDDGNGRISRAVADLVLSEIEQSEVSKLYSMSSAINKNKKSYYTILDETTGFKNKKSQSLDISGWIEWFLTTLIIALEDAKSSLGYILQKTEFWDKYRDENLNARQIKVINKILDKGVNNYEGGLNNRQYVAITKTSSATATRDLKDLLDRGCISLKEGTTGKSSSYILEVPTT